MDKKKLGEKGLMIGKINCFAVNVPFPSRQSAFFLLDMCFLLDNKHFQEKVPTDRKKMHFWALKMPCSHFKNPFFATFSPHLVPRY